MLYYLAYCFNFPIKAPKTAKQQVLVLNWFDKITVTGASICCKTGGYARKGFRKRSRKCLMLKKCPN